MATSRKRYIFNRGTNGATASAYLGLPIFSTPTATIGDVCIRSGSIIGLAVTLNVTAQTQAGNVVVDVRLEDIVKDSITIAVNGTNVYTAYELYASDTYTITAGNMLSMLITFGGAQFQGTVSVLGTVIIENNL